MTHKNGRQIFGYTTMCAHTIYFRTNRMHKSREKWVNERIADRKRERVRAHNDKWLLVFALMSHLQIQSPFLSLSLFHTNTLSFRFTNPAHGSRAFQFSKIQNTYQKRKLHVSQQSQMIETKVFTCMAQRFNIYEDKWRQNKV